MPVRPRTLSKRALELLPAGDAEHGLLVAETVGVAQPGQPLCGGRRVGRWRRSRRLASPERRPRFAAPRRRSISTVHSGASRRIVERCSWTTSARSPGPGIWGGWPTTWRCTTNVGNGARRPTRLPRPRHPPVISRPRSWPMSPSLCSTVGRGTRAARTPPRGALRARPHEGCVHSS
jgi:hypothetical protein